MKILSRIASLILVLALCLSAFASCVLPGNGGNTDEGTNNNNGDN